MRPADSLSQIAQAVVLVPLLSAGATKIKIKEMSLYLL